MSLVDKSLLDLFLYARNSGAVRVNKDGVYEVVPANAPRLDYDPVTRKPLGLLFEGIGRTNYLNNSDDVSQGYWYKGRTEFGEKINTKVGVLSKLIATSIDGPHHFSRAGFPFKAGTPYCLSTVFKADEFDRCLVQLGNNVGAKFGGGTNAGALFDLRTKTVINKGSERYGIIDLGDGLYRCWVSSTATVTSPDTIFGGFILDSASNVSYLGDDVSGMYVGCVDLIEGLYPASHVTTTTTAVSRAADWAAIKPDLLPSLINPKEGTVVIRFAHTAMPNIGSHTMPIRLLGANNARVQIISTVYDDGLRFFNELWYLDPTTNTSKNVIASKLISRAYKAIPLGEPVTIAISYKDGQLGIAYGGNSHIATIPLGLIPTFTAVDIGAYCEGRIESLKFLPRALPEPMLLNASLGLI